MTRTTGSPTGGQRRRRHRTPAPAVASVQPSAPEQGAPQQDVLQPVAGEGELPPGRTPPLDPAEARRLFHEGVALFNAVRYWHAHEAWETIWRAAPDDERDFYQGLIQVAAGLLHLQRRNARGARNKLTEGLARLGPFQPVHRGIFVNELVGRAERILRDLEDGYLPYLIPPVIRFVDADQPDWSR